MRTKIPLGGLFLVATFAVLKADSGPVLLDLVRKKVLENITQLPQYTCVETINRSEYRPGHGRKTNSCPATIAIQREISPSNILIWQDRLRLDVAIGNKSEMYSWAGAREFETDDIHTLAEAGVTGTGDFSSFLASIFGNDAEGFHYTGESETPLGRMAGYAFTVPLGKSHYSYSTTTTLNRIVPYHGSFFVNPSSAELRRITVDADQFPSGNVCRVLNVVDYQRVKIGEGDFPLPQVSTMTVLYNDGQESINETHYSGCRQYVAEATVHFGDELNVPSGVITTKTPDVPMPLPPKTRINIRIEPSVNVATAAAGDPITGVVEHEVKKLGETLLREGDMLHGRLLRVEQRRTSAPTWTIAIRFSTVERNGIKQPITLKPLDDGERFLIPKFMVRRQQGDVVPSVPPRPIGGGIFLFEAAETLVLDRNFHSAWETK